MLSLNFKAKKIPLLPLFLASVFSIPIFALLHYLVLFKDTSINFAEQELKGVDDLKNQIILLENQWIKNSSGEFNLKIEAILKRHH
jgi:hypothetical protein